jgi:ADP-heptose:LPS heptosyltransferase
MKKRKIKPDCQHFLGDRPCQFHKQSQTECFNCSHYLPLGYRILVIKLEAMGDVLRTTSILPGLFKKYSPCSITWITQDKCVDLLRNNPYIYRILTPYADSPALFAIEEFDLLINLDTSFQACSLATLAKANIKKGFGLSPKGYIYPLNLEAEKWFLMGLFDDLKKKNSQTYQQIIFKIIGMKYYNYEPVLNLIPEEIDFANNFKQRLCLKNNIPTIGIHLGAGNRWPKKKWKIESFIKLIKKLKADINMQILLFGAEGETELNKQILKTFPGEIINTGLHNSVREFASLINLCDVIVAADTLMMHIAIALKKKCVVLFGPTSSQEIDLYGRGEKIVAHFDCICCYRQSCDKNPDCMDYISADEVYDAVKRLI